MLWTQFCVVHLVANSAFINLWNCVVILVSFANSNSNIICTSVTKVMVNLWQLKACFVSNSKPDLCRFLNVICDDLKEWRHLPAWHTPSGRWQTAGYDEKMGISVTKSIRHQTQTPLTTPSESTGRQRIMTKMVVHQWPKPTVIDWISFCDHRHFVTE